MNNFLKVIFGIPTDDQQNSREDDRPSGWERNFRSNFGGNNDDNDDYDGNDSDDMRMHPGVRGGSGMGFFGFPVFSDPIEIQKYFESVVDTMHKQFEVFGFHNGLNITWEDGKEGFSSQYVNEEPVNKSASLRDAFLKSPGYVSDTSGRKQDIDLDGRVKAEEVENLLRTEPSFSTNAPVQHSPQIYAKYVYVKTVTRPDGSVETVKKIRDHTGKEETITTITQPDGQQLPANNQIIPQDDVPGLSLLKKLFSF